MDPLLNRLPSPILATLTPAAQRLAVAQAIEAHLLGAVTLKTLAAWGLKAFHSRETADTDDDGDDWDDDDTHTTGDALEEALDLLMFADDPDVAPSREELTAAVRQLRTA